MGLEEVKSDILDEAEAKADQIIQEAEKEKQKIITEAKEKAEKIKQEHREELEEEKEGYRRKAVSNARMKAKEEKLHAREESLSKVFKGFRERLGEMSDEEKESYVEECLQKPEFDIGKVIGSEEFEQFVDEEFEVDNSVNGVIVVSEDEARRQNFGFDKIVEQYKSSYRKQVAEELFE